MPTEKRVPSLIVNTLTEAQYQALENPSDTEMWVTPYEESILPDQTGQSGKFLTTDGTDASWATVDTLPSQSGQSGKFLTTDGTDASWASVSVPANVYTQDNLLAGTNISLTEEQVISGGGIDEYTAVCLHLDENLNNSSQYNVNPTIPSGVSASYMIGRFSKGLEKFANYTGDMTISYSGWDNSLAINNGFTLDYWQYYYSPTANNASAYIQVENSSGYRWYVYLSPYGGLGIVLGGQTEIWFSNSSQTEKYNELLSLLKQNDWNHIALQVKKGESSKLFINGTLWYENTDSTYNNPNFFSSNINYLKIAATSSFGLYSSFDEVRLSSIERYTGDFTPEDAPYSSDAPIITTVKKINNTMPSVSVMTGATSSVAGTSGLVPAPAAGDQAKYLTGAGTWQTVNALQNTATASGALTILGTANTSGGNSVNIGTSSTAGGNSNSVSIGYKARTNSDYGVAIGGAESSSAMYGAYSGQYSVAVGTGSYGAGMRSVAIGYGATTHDNYGRYAVAIGDGAYCNGYYSIALGRYAHAEAQSAIQIGEGTNSTANTVQIDTYQVFDRSTGKIPAARMSLAAGLGMPGSTYDNITIGASAATYTATHDGWLFLRYDVNSTATAYVNVGQNGHVDQQVYNGAAHTDCYIFTPIKAGTYQIDYGNLTFSEAKLFYLSGQE